MIESRILIMMLIILVGGVYGGVLFENSDGLGKVTGFLIFVFSLVGSWFYVNAKINFEPKTITKQLEEQGIKNDLVKNKIIKKLSKAECTISNCSISFIYDKPIEKRKIILNSDNGGKMTFNLSKDNVYVFLEAINYVSQH